MANLTYTADIKEDVLRRCGELTNGSSKFDTQVLDYINRVHMELICGGSTFVPELAEPWPWARAATPGLLVLQPAFDSALGLGLNLTHLSAAASFVTAPAAALGSFVGRYIWTSDYSDVYRITAHVAGAASLTLDMPWQGPTVVQGQFRCAQLDYALGAGSIARLVEPFRIFQLQSTSGTPGKIEGMSPDQLHRRFPLFQFGSASYATPSSFAIVSEAANVPVVRFNAVPPTAARVEYEYIPVPADLTISATPASDPLPLVPREHRSVLSLGACFWLMVDKEDSRADMYQTMTQRKIQGMLLSRRRQFDEQSEGFAKLSPRQGATWRPVPRSTSGLRFP